MSERLETALYYLSLGWAVRPLSPNAKVLYGTECEKFLHGKIPFGVSQSPEEVQRWFDLVPDLNIGIAMRESGLAVLDVDYPVRFDAWAAQHGGMMRMGPVVITRRGRHYYFQARGTEVSGIVYDHGGYFLGDFQAPRAPDWKSEDMAYVVAPPSVVDGHTYRWEIPPSVLPPVLTAPLWITVDSSEPNDNSSWMYDCDDDLDEDDDAYGVCEVCGGEFWDGGMSCVCQDYQWGSQNSRRLYPSMRRRKFNGRLRPRREVRDIQAQSARIPAQEIQFPF